MRRVTVVLMGTAALLVAACSADPPRPPDPNRPAVTLDDVAARAAHTATALPDGRVLVAGGCVVDGCAEATRETFLVAPDGAVRVGPALSTARDAHTATYVEDRVVLAGGFSGEGGAPSASVDVVATDGTLRTLRLGEGRGGHAAAALPDGRGLLVGGWVAPRTYTASVELVDPVAGTVDPGPALPVAADGLDAVALADGRVLVTGGQTSPGVGSRRAFLLDRDGREWREVGPMREARFKHVSVALPDGRVLVLGGTPDDTTTLRSTEVLDPVTGRFTPGPTLREPRYKMAGGAVLVGERVVVAGGGRSVELLDLTAGTSHELVTFPVRGSFATVSPVGTDRLLVLGGYDDDIVLRRRAELIPVPAT